MGRKQVIQARGNNASVEEYTGPAGELVVNTDTSRLHVQDGETPGGFPTARLDEHEAVAGRVTDVETAVGDLETGATAMAESVAALSADRLPLAKAIGGLAWQEFFGMPCPPEMEFDPISCRAQSNNAPAQMVFQRASSAYRVNAAGLLESVDVDVFRIDYDPNTHECLGWLIEGEFTNLHKYSQDFTQSLWTKSNGATVDSNTVVAPDGTLTADTITATTLTSVLAQNSTISSHGEHVGSLFIKKGSSDNVRFGVRFAGGTVLSIQGAIDMNTMTVSELSGATIQIKEFHNGWYRVAYSIEDTSGDNTVGGIYLYPDLYNGTGSVHVWEGEFGEGERMSSIAPTTSAAATRAMDIPANPVANFTHNPEGWTVFVEAHTPNGGVEDNVLFDVGGTNAHGETAYVARSSGGIVVGGDISPVNLGLTIADPDASEWHRVALAVADNDAAMSYNGRDVLIDNACAAPVDADYILVGCSGWNWTFANHINGHVRRLLYFPSRLTNAQLKALTA